MTTFALAPRLLADTLAVGDLPLSRVILMNDQRYLWLMLVPRREDVVEIVDLAPVDRTALLEEIVAASKVLQALRPGAKLNVAAIGNRVSQLHVHVLTRVVGDPAWPGPVFGHSPSLPYAAEDGTTLAADLARALQCRTDAT